MISTYNFIMTSDSEITTRNRSLSLVFLFYFLPFVHCKKKQRSCRVGPFSFKVSMLAVN